MTAPFGNRVRHQQPAPFRRARRCRRNDARRLMNAWGRSKSIANAGRLAKLLGCSTETMKQAIRATK